MNDDIEENDSEMVHSRYVFILHLSNDSNLLTLSLPGQSKNLSAEHRAPVLKMSKMLSLLWSAEMKGVLAYLAWHGII